MPALRFPFSDLPLFAEGDLRTGLVDGEAEVEYDEAPLEPSIERITVFADGGKIELEPGTLKWAVVEAALCEHRLEQIKEAVAIEVSAAAEYERPFCLVREIGRAMWGEA
jgi:hypothetical protein